MKWGKHAAGLLRTLDQIRGELFSPRELNKKGVEHADVRLGKR
jgi:hypothetical protein